MEVACEASNDAGPGPFLMLCKQLGGWANMEEHHPLPHSPRGEKSLSRAQCGPDTGLPWAADGGWVPWAEQGLASPLAGPSLEPREGQYKVNPLVFPPVSPSTAKGDEAVLPVSPPSCRQHSRQQGIKRGEHHASPCSSGQPWLGPLADG